MLRSTKQGESVCVVVARQEDIFLPRELVGRKNKQQAPLRRRLPDPSIRCHVSPRSLVSVTYFPPRFLHIVSAFKGSNPPPPTLPFQSVPSLPINTATPTRPGHAPAFLPHSALLTQQRSRKRRTNKWQETCQRVPPPRPSPPSPLYVDTPLVLSDRLPARPGGVKGLWDRHFDFGLSGGLFINKHMKWCVRLCTPPILCGYYSLTVASKSSREGTWGSL